MLLSNDAIAEIRKRATSFSRDSSVIAASMDTPEDAQIVADYGALLADRDELAQRLAKVRERVVGRPVLVAGVLNIEGYTMCTICEAYWLKDIPESHEPDCPAAPVEAAPMEDAP